MRAADKSEPGGDNASDRRFLLERSGELEVIDETVEALQEGRGGLLLLRGPAGIGKSSLLAELVARTADGPALALRSKCTPLEQDFSFGIPLALFEQHIRSQDEEQRARLLEGSAVNATAVLEVTEEGETQPFPLLHGLYWLTANIASQAPLLITVDDAQWADVSSLRYLAFLSHRMADLPITLAVSLRSGEAAGAQAELLDQLLTSPSIALLEPSPLSEVAVTELLESRLARPAKRFCRACADATGGNPFLLRELIDALRSEGTQPTAAAAERVNRLVPASLRGAVLLRLGRLHGAGIALSKAVAILGDGADLRQAATLSGISMREAELAADALAEAGILDLADGPRFVHPLIASTINAELGSAERSRLHRAAADLTAAKARRAERVAAHLLKAPTGGDAWVVETLRAAAREALSQGSPASAVQYLGRALAEPPAAPAEVRFELGRAELLAGRGDRAVATLRTAFELSLGPADAARTHNALGHAQYATGKLADAAASFSAGLDAAGREEPELALRNQADLMAIGLLVPGLHEQVAGQLPAAIARVRAGEPSGPGRAILASGALHSVVAGEPAGAAIALAQEALDGGRLIAEEGADSATVYSVSGVLSTCGQFATAVAVLDQAVAEAQRSGSVMGYANALYSRSHANLGRGRLVDSIADVRAALDARQFGWRQYLPVANTFLVLALLERGESEEAGKVIAEASTEDWDADLTWSVMFWARGAHRLATGRPADALRDFHDWGRRWQVPNPAFYAEWRSCAAVAAASLGDREQAVELAAEELACVDRFDSARSTGIARRALGIAQAGEEGVETLRSAVAALSDCDAELERCRATVDLGACLRREGRRVDAREALTGGLGLARDLGATALAGRAAEELKLAGGRPRRRDASGVDSLTPGELRVARMAAAEMSNREIAQALFVTPKAVQWHLRNTYRKLEIDTRDQIAGLLGTPETDD